MAETPREKDAIQADIVAFLAEQCYLPADAADPDTALFSSGTLSSIDLIDLVAFMEERFGIAIEPTEVELDKLDTVARITAFVRAKGEAA